jgi:DNA replication protein DnaC
MNDRGYEQLIKELELKEYFDRLSFSGYDKDTYKYSLKQPWKHDCMQELKSGKVFSAYLWGTPGTGKTITAHQAIYYFTRRAKWTNKNTGDEMTGMTVLYFPNTIDLVNKLNDFDTRKAFISRCMNTQVLMLDNFYRYGKEEKCGELFDIIDKRLPKKLIWFISNDYDKIASHLSPSLKRRVDDYCKIYEFKEKLF